MSTGQAPSTPAAQFQVDAYPGADTAILGSAAVTTDFWNYYGPWATAYALYYGIQLEVTNYVYSPPSIERTITVPGEWEAWVSTLGIGATKPSGAVAPAPPPPPPPTTPPTTTNWTLVAVSGFAATSVVVLFLLALKHGGRAATPTANPTLSWYPDRIGNDWLSSGPRGTFRLTPQPDGQWIVIHLSTKYGPVATLDDAKSLAEFLNVHTRSALPRGGKRVMYTGTRRFYRTEKIMPPSSSLRGRPRP